MEPNANLYDCDDFLFREDAQVFLTPGDPHALDGDGDGRACELLPLRGTVDPGNAAPTARTDQAATMAGETVAITVLANDADADGTIDQLFLWTVPDHGFVQVTAEREITYCPDAGFTGTDSFDYLVFDDDGGFARARVTVEVRGELEIGEGLSPAQARTVALLYEAGLNRDGAIAPTGLNFWIDRREGGLSEVGLAQRFLASPEFEAAFGDPLDPADPRYLEDQALVEQLFLNVLDRPGGAGGIAFWTGRLADPSFDRADLLLAFAKSPENVAGADYLDTLAEIAPGEWDFVA